jgi:hypothetical protein
MEIKDPYNTFLQTPESLKEYFDFSNLPIDHFLYSIQQ